MTMKEDYCEEVQEIMGHIPHWIIRWGIIVIALVFFSIIIGCYFIKYPQVVESSIIITTINPPSQLIARHSGLIDSLSNVISTETSILELQQNKEELYLQLKQEKYDSEKTIIQCKEQLLADIALWCEEYVFEAPIDGIVSFNNVWKENQSIVLGNVFATVIPSDDVSVVGKVKVGSDRFGEVAIGQDVIIKLNGYPYMEYGVIYGKVSAISEMPEVSDGGIYYSVDVYLGNCIVTNLNKKLPLIQYMDGSAEIVTKEKRLLDYFVDPILYIFSDSFKL